jgi:hypothetical protein
VPKSSDNSSNSPFPVMIDVELNNHGWIPTLEILTTAIERELKLPDNRNNCESETKSPNIEN